jgi:hypothetical protein
MTDVDGFSIPTRLLSSAAIGSEVVIQDGPATYRGRLLAVSGHARSGELAVAVTLACNLHDDFGNRIDVEVNVVGDGTQLVAVLGVPEADESRPGTPEADAADEAGADGAAVHDWALDEAGAADRTEPA